MGDISTEDGALDAPSSAIPGSWAVVGAIDTYVEVLARSEEVVSLFQLESNIGALLVLIKDVKCFNSATHCCVGLSVSEEWIVILNNTAKYCVANRSSLLWAVTLSSCS